ncbi:hypothetical protein J6590_072404 [Homalodisca vitripennis]|nr:hypothetical protein J6590_072404 [Homalodisca vitripennis]
METLERFRVPVEYQSVRNGATLLAEDKEGVDKQLQKIGRQEPGKRVTTSARKKSVIIIYGVNTALRDEGTK